MSNTLLKVENLNVYYGVIQALKGVSFEVNEGARPVSPRFCVLWT